MRMDGRTDDVLASGLKLEGGREGERAWHSQHERTKKRARLYILDSRHAIKKEKKEGRKEGRARLRRHRRRARASRAPGSFDTLPVTGAGKGQCQ